MNGKKIYFRFCLTIGKDIYLNDVEYKNKYDDIKGSNLKKFLKSAQTEFHFSKTPKNRLQNIYWYSNQHSERYFGLRKTKYTKFNERIPY